MSGIRCPSCGSYNLTVIDSRAAESYIRRRRVCQECGTRVTTREHADAIHECGSISRQISRAIQSAERDAADVLREHARKLCLDWQQRGLARSQIESAFERLGIVLDLRPNVWLTANLHLVTDAVTNALAKRTELAIDAAHQGELSEGDAA